MGDSTGGSMTLWIVGAILVLGGGAFAAKLLGAPTTWIIVGVIIVAGLLFMSAARFGGTRRLD